MGRLGIAGRIPASHSKVTTSRHNDYGLAFPHKTANNLIVAPDRSRLCVRKNEARNLLRNARRRPS